MTAMSHYAAWVALACYVGVALLRLIPNRRIEDSLQKQET